MKKKYAWRKKNYGNFGCAQTVGEYLEKRFPDGDFKTTDIYKDAKNKHSPFHKPVYGELTDVAAAKAYRLHVIRNMVSAIYIVVEDRVETRAYESVRTSITSGTSYVNYGRVIADNYLTDQVLAQAKREILYWEAKYSLYKIHLPEIFEAIRKLREEEKTSEKEGKELVAGKGTERSNSADRHQRSKDKANRDHTPASE